MNTDSLLETDLTDLALETSEGRLPLAASLASAAAPAKKNIRPKKETVRIKPPSKPIAPATTTGPTPQQIAAAG